METLKDVAIVCAVIILIVWAIGAVIALAGMILIAIGEWMSGKNNRW